MATELKLPGSLNNFLSGCKMYLGISIFVFIMAHNANVEAVGLGDPCTDTLQCPGSFQYCNIDKCGCRPNFKEIAGECKKDHQDPCSTTDECRSLLQCVAHFGNNKYCLCAENQFWYPAGETCNPVTDLLVSSVVATPTFNSVTLTWAITNNYGQAVSVRLTWDGVSWKPVTSPHDVPSLSLNKQYSYSLVPYLPKNDYYTERVGTPTSTKTVRTKKDHQNECAANNNECRSPLQCLPRFGKNYCLCDQNKFWYSTDGTCKPVTDLQVSSVVATSTFNSVTLTWTVSNDYGKPVSVGLKWNGGLRKPVTSPYTVPSLSPNKQYSYSLEPYLPGNYYYTGRVGTPTPTKAVKTKKDHQDDCTVNDECRSSLQCVAYAGNDKYCLCTENQFWYAAWGTCKSVNELRMNNIKVSKTTDTVTFSGWTASKYDQNVVYTIEWENLSKSITSTSYYSVPDLTPGTEYTFSFKSILPSDSFYSKREAVTSKTVIMKPAKPGEVDVGNSKLSINPMTGNFESSSGIVAYYVFTIVELNLPKRINSNEVTFTLDNGVVYNYKITAYNSGNEASEQRTGSFRTKAAASSPVTYLRVEDITSNSVLVKWNVPTNPNGIIQAFSIHVVDETTQNCLQGYLMLCTDCAKKTSPGQSECGTVNNNFNFTSNQAIKGSPHTFNYDVSSLLPYKRYTIKVYAFNEGGQGEPETRSFATLEDVANNIQSIDALLKRDDAALQVYLDVKLNPGVQTGLTNFSVSLIDVQNNPTDIVKTETLIGYSNTNVIFPDLLAYHEYKLSAYAVTQVGGRSEITESITVTTLSSKPGIARNLNVIPDAVVATKFNLAFDCPLPGERNGTIKNVNVTKRSHGSSLIEYFGFPMPSKCQLSLPSGQLGSFQVSQNFSFSVTINNGFIESDQSQVVSFYTHPKPPIFEPSVELIAPTSEPSTSETSIQIKVCSACLINKLQGSITITGLIVCVKSNKNTCDNNGRKRRSTKTTDDFLNYSTWIESKSSGFTSSYRATPDDWLKTNPSENYTIGSDTTCQKAINSNSHCNGPLPSGKEVVVIAFSCTSGGCEESKPYLFRIQVSDDDDNTGVIVGVVVAVLVVLVITVLAVLFILNRRRSRKPQETQDNIMLRDSETVESRPIPIRKFKETVAKYHKDANLLFQSEFEDIKALSTQRKGTTHEATKEENRVKNRYVDILPYDHSRVKLQVDSDYDTSDYINSSYIPGFHSPREYIATQGPMHSTIPHFWRMVWEQKSSVIVMLSDSTQNVEVYWPNNLNEPTIYGDLLVKITQSNVLQLNKYIIRNLTISCGKLERHVTHFSCPGLVWDLSANESFTDFLQFAQLIRKETKPPNAGPVVVHCGSGAGRTGTFIALDYFMQYIDKHGMDADLDIFSYVMSMRKNRPRMVQDEHQYIFIFDALMEQIERKMKPEQDGIYNNSNIYEVISEENIYLTPVDISDDQTYSNG